MKHIFLYFLLTGCLLLAGCKDEAPDPLSQLPPATTIGARTFGCLLNGKAWTPKGRITHSSNLIESYNHGDFNVVASRKDDQIYESMGIYSDSLFQVGVYPLNNPKRQAAIFISNSCEYLRDTDVTREGTLTITRIDIPQGIISGKFEFTLIKPDCDTIRVTDGRFDLAL